MDLDKFLADYQEDDNVWWRVDTGTHQNLFDALMERHKAAETEAAKWKAYRLCASHHMAPDALDYGHDTCVLCLMNARDNLREEVERLQSDQLRPVVHSWL